jgi:phosphosulfolactate phosphohydrolase-like enzyme
VGLGAKKYRLIVPAENALGVAMSGLTMSDPTLGERHGAAVDGTDLGNTTNT